jgi:mono/diheme cytochrome c family protein
MLQRPARILAFSWLIGVGAALSPALAQELEEQGHKLARQWCSGCHLVEPGQATRLTQWLSDPHPPMPNLSLANEEIAALVAYIGSLRTE